VGVMRAVAHNDVTNHPGDLASGVAPRADTTLRYAPASHQFTVADVFLASSGSAFIHDQMHVEFLRHCFFNRAQELQELLRAVASMQLTDDFAGGDIKGCKQRGGAVPAIVMGAPFRVDALLMLNGGINGSAQHLFEVPWMAI
jgi:hypothetical protein